MFERIGFLQTVLREGESDGGGGASGTAPSPPSDAASTDTAASPPADAGQQPAEPDASAQATASAEDGAPAGDAEGDDAPKDEAKPDELPDLPDETIANLIEAYGEKWREHPEFKKWVAEEATQLTQKQLAELQRAPEADPYYREITQEAETALGAIVELTQQYEQGQIDVDPRDLAGHVVKVKDSSEAAAYRTGMLSQDHGLAQVVIEKNAGKMPADDDPVHKEAQAARQKRDDALTGVFRLKRQADAAAKQGRQAEAQKLRQQVAQADQQVRDTFTTDTLRIAIDYGMRLGETKGLSRNEKQTAAKVALAKDNALKQAAARLAAGKLPAGVNGGNGNGSSVTTYADLQKLPDADKVRWIDGNPAKFNEFLGIK